MEKTVRNKIAVASCEGVLVNQHLGMAEYLMIFQPGEDGHQLVTYRVTPSRGGGEKRWQQLSGLLSDCHTLLVNGIGDAPCEMLSADGITIYEIEGLIDDALDAIQRGETLRMPRRSRIGCRRAEMGIGGTGCD